MPEAEAAPTPVAELLAKVVAGLDAGEPRPGQLAMAEAVARAVATHRHLVVSAGTGTGKSLAYLVPAVAAGERVVVATATKALQEQLAGKDLPFLSEQLGGDLSFAVLKGRANYVCLQRVGELEQRAAGEQGTLELDGNAAAEGVGRVVEGGRKTEKGDRAELPWEPSARSWSAVSVTSQECPGAARCPSGDECLAEHARRVAAQADVVVVNTHLYGMHVASHGALLPDHDLVILDEAHQVEEVMASALGVDVTAGRFAALARTVGAIVADDALRADLDGAGTRLLGAFGGRSGDRLAPGDESLGGFLDLARGRVERAIDALRKVPDGAAAEVRTRRDRAQKACLSLVEDLDTLLTARADDVVWVEGPDHNPALRLAPVEVASRLAATWLDTVAVLTSATVPPGLAARLGLPADRHDVLDVGSPFDYRRQALLYCARHLPDPRNDDWMAAAIEELDGLIRAAGGRTLALFTSWRVMQAAAGELAGRLPFPVLTQADLPKRALVEAFTADEATCLFATMSFWQGVDVPGRALSLVVIDRLPFGRPDEPLLQARRERAGDRAFATVDLPRAATLLAQGAGRLIRGSSDRGVVAVLDRRLATAGYRRDLLALVPPMKRTVDPAEVAAFLGEITAHG